MMMKCIRSLWVFFVFVLVMFVNSSANITVFPLTLAVSAAPGDSGSGAFFVRNSSDKTDEVTITVADWTLQLDGNIQFLEAGSTDRSLAPFVQFAPVNFQVEPGQVQRVEFSYDVPKDQAGDHWMLFLVDSGEITPIGGTTGEVTTSVGVRVGFGVKLLQNDPGAKQDGRVVGMRLLGKDPLSLAMRFTNTGEAILRDITGRIEVRNVMGETVRTFEPKPFTVLPGGTRELSVTQAEGDPKLPAGDYVALAIVDFGADFLVAGELPFTLN